MHHWFRYSKPAILVDKGSEVIATFEVWLVEINLKIGYIERYHYRDGHHLWRSIDFEQRNWRKGFATREEAAQNLVNSCPSVRKEISLLRPDYNLN